MKTNLGTHRFIDSKFETFLGFLTENQLLILTREALPLAVICVWNYV